MRFDVSCDKEATQLSIWNMLLNLAVIWSQCIHAINFVYAEVSDSYVLRIDVE